LGWAETGLILYIIIDPALMIIGTICGFCAGMRETDSRKLSMPELNERPRQALQFRIKGMG